VKAKIAALEAKQQEEEKQCLVAEPGLLGQNSTVELADEHRDKKQRRVK